jgi:ankyrin repeat protein
MALNQITIDDYFRQCENGTILTIENSRLRDTYNMPYYNVIHNHTFKTPLFISAQNGHLDNTLHLLNENAYKEHHCNSEDYITPLIAATINDHHDIVRALLDYGADIESKDINANTALHYAVEHDRIAMVEYLLQKGLNINERNWKHETALHLACEQDQVTDTLAMPSFLATYLTAKVDLQDIHGYTPLHYACCKGRIDVVSMLIRNNHDIHQLDNDFRTCSDMYGDWNADMNEEDIEHGQSKLMKDYNWHRRKNYSMFLSSIKNVSHNICIQNDNSTIPVTQEMEVTNNFFTIKDVVQIVGKYL